MSDLFATIAARCGADPLPTRVRARHAIADTPLARHDASAPRGAIGSVEDDADGLLWVDFGRGAIACSPDEVVAIAW